MQLIRPDIRYKESYLSALDEAKNEAEILAIYKPPENLSFEEYLNELHARETGEHLPQGWVPETVLWLIDNDAFIGRASIRHSLNEHLLQIGGHIGYFIRPTQRNKGYGKMILKLALIEAGKMGIIKVLVTCDETNIASQKVIEANGGVLENIVANGVGNPRKKRYWIMA